VCEKAQQQLTKSKVSSKGDNFELASFTTAKQTMSTGIKRNREVAEELKNVAETMGAMTGAQLAVANAMTGVEGKMSEVHPLVQELTAHVNDLEDASIMTIQEGVQKIADTVDAITVKLEAVNLEMATATTTATDMVEWGQVAVQEEIAKIHAARKRMYGSNNSLLQSRNARKKTTAFSEATTQGAKAMAGAIEMMVGSRQYGVAIAHDMVRAQLSNGVATREDEAYLAKVLGIGSDGLGVLEQGYTNAKAHHQYYAENAMMAGGNKKPSVNATAGTALKHAWRMLPECSNATAFAMNRIMATALQQMQAKWKEDVGPNEDGMIGMDEVRAFMTCNLMHHNLNNYGHTGFGGVMYQEPPNYDEAGAAGEGGN
jgi:hypothetical protein